jgi:hypothetical protein
MLWLCLLPENPQIRDQLVDVEVGYWQYNTLDIEIYVKYTKFPSLILLSPLIWVNIHPWYKRSDSISFVTIRLLHPAPSSHQPSYLTTNITTVHFHVRFAHKPYTILRFSNMDFSKESLLVNPRWTRFCCIPETMDNSRRNIIITNKPFSYTFKE